ncbi:MAG: FGGY family carbohydrate kinase [Gemmatimonadota bacterium]
MSPRRPYLAIDFGTTSTKSAVVDLDTGVFHHLVRHPSIPASPGPAGHHEVPLAAIRARFDEICTGYLDRDPAHPFAGIVLCSEMHGFAVLDAATRQPLTDYVSWLDARALEPVDGIDTFSMVSGRLGSRFKAVTGMRPRPGFPLLNFTHLARRTRLPERPLLVSLPAFLALGGAPPHHPVLEHPTILAGMALYDVGRGEVSEELLDLVGQVAGCRPSAGQPAPEGTVAGHWRRGEVSVPVYVGVGDHQCSVLGAGLTPGDSASLNLGTGSQVTVLERPAPDEAETRPYFDSRLLRTMTHIPAGRALAEYVGFLQRIAESVGAPAGARPAPDAFWGRLARLGPLDLEAATLEIDLAVFEGARNDRGGGAIARIAEGALTPQNYLASLLEAFVSQYVEVLRLFDPERQLQRLVLSGGIARNLPRLAEILGARTGCEAVSAASLDESLLGLRTLALVADGRAATCAAAQAVFGRDSTVVS